MTKPHPSWPRHNHVKRGTTLVEIIVSMMLVTLLCAGVISGMIQSRRMTEGSIAQGTALAAAESFMEQMRGMSLAALVNSNGLLDTAQNPLPSLGTSYAIQIEFDDKTTDNLWTSTGTIPDIGATGFTPGNTPAGVVNNLKDIPADPLNLGATLAWNAPTTVGTTTFPAVWPGANNYVDGASNAFSAPMQKNIHMDFWVWVKDVSGGTGLPSAQHNAYSITLIYTWKFWDGIEWQKFTGCLRTIRSVVPTWNK